MQVWLKTLWFLVVFLNFSSVLWFVLGTTAFFKRGIDLVTSVRFIFFGVPSILLIILSSYLLLKKWNPVRWWEITFVCILMISMLLLTPMFYKNVDTRGWLTEKVEMDSLQVTADNRFEYRIEMVNMFQKNNSARLYLKNTQTLQEMRIPLKLPLSEIDAIMWKSENYFVHLEPTENENKYILLTTKDSPFPGKKFEINVEDGTAIEIK